MNNKEASKSAFENKSTSKAGGPQPMSMGFFLPVNRFGEIEDIANMAIYLASPAGSYVTGFNLVADGG